MHSFCSCTFFALLMSIITDTHQFDERNIRLVKSSESLVDDNNQIKDGLGHNGCEICKKTKLAHLKDRAKPRFKGLTKRTKPINDVNNSKPPKRIAHYRNKANRSLDSENHLDTLMYIKKEIDQHLSEKDSNYEYSDIVSELGTGFMTTDATESEYTTLNEAHVKETKKVKIQLNIDDYKVATSALRNKASMETNKQNMYRNLLQLDLKPGLNSRINDSNSESPDDFYYETRAIRHENPRTNAAPLYTEIAHRGTDDPLHNISVDSSVADQLAKKVRVLCWIMTEAKRHKTNAVHVKATWGKRCNKLVILSNAKDPSLSVVNLHFRDQLGDKIVEAFSYIHKRYRNEADWFLKADDDTYVIVENLRYMLADFDSTKPLYFGCRFKPYTKQGYMSGGAGYVLSRAALDRLNRAFQIPELCNMHRISAEDVGIGKCLERIGVRPMDTRDPLGRGRFFPFPPKNHLFPDKKKMGWYYDYLYYPAKEGLTCCSNTAISFHALQAKDMYILDYLIYHLKPHSRPPQVTEATSQMETERKGSPVQDVRTTMYPVAEIQYNVVN